MIEAEDLHVKMYLRSSVWRAPVEGIRPRHGTSVIMSSPRLMPSSCQIRIVGMLCLDHRIENTRKGNNKIDGVYLPLDLRALMRHDPQR